MENHPIPQDVTGFKFRLIGSITLKQFLYMMGAGGICLILYLLPMSVFLKYPLMAIPIIISLCLAFVPIDGRPMDKMILNFAKAIPAENEYIYKKTGVEMPFFSFNPPVHARPVATTDQRTSQKAVLFNQLSRSYFKPDKEEQEGIEAISSLFEGKTPSQGFVNRVIQADKEPVKQAAPAPLPSTPFESKEDKKEEEILAKPHTPEPKQETPTVSPPVTAPQGPAVSQPVQQQPVATPPVPVTKPSYETPNVIEGVVKDPRGKPLPHVIVEIIDQNNIPQRTFRTNQNGTFISATPLPNGTYTIHLEDTLKKQDFEDKTIVATGTVLPVIEIVSIDQREKLRRELFGHA